MSKQGIDNVKLGAFVIAGLLFLVILLYMIGNNRSFFGNTFALHARFENVQGLVTGNNVRYAGINAGTVKRINILNDTVIEVTMMIETEMKGIIHENAVVSIGTDGLVGNKVVNIVPSHKRGRLAQENDVLFAKKAVDTEDLLQTLSKSNADIAVIASELKTTVQRINNSNALWSLLNDNSVPKNLRTSMADIHSATGKAVKMVDNLNAIVMDVRNGKGSAGAIISDTLLAFKLNEAITKIKNVGVRADNLADDINKLVAGIGNDLNNGKGPANALFKDSALVMKLNASLDNIQQGTNGFNQNMEALKHNFLFRSYFKRLEKQREKDIKQQKTAVAKQ